MSIQTDPADPGTPAQYESRHTFLRSEYADIGTVNTWLNEIDARLQHASRSQSAQLVAFRRKLTIDPRNVEDLQGPEGLREHLLDLAGRVGGTSYQAPTADETAEGAHLHQQLESLKIELSALGH